MQIIYWHETERRLHADGRFGAHAKELGRSNNRRAQTSILAKAGAACCAAAWGGFGTSSTFTWDAMTLIGCNFWENATILGGYRAVGRSYESGSGRDNFKANATMHGPVAGMAFTF